MSRSHALLRPPLLLPTSGPVGFRNRVLLVGEILRAYVPLARRVRSNDVEAMVREARKPDRRVDEPSSFDARATAVRLGRIVERLLTVLPTDDRCLIRALVLLRLLARRGIAGRLVIGVRTDTGFGAHAWIELDDRPVLPSAGFSRLLEL